MIVTPSLVRAVSTFLALANHRVAVASGSHAQHYRGLDKQEHHVKAQSIIESNVAEYAKMTKVDDDVVFYWNVKDDILDARVVYNGLAWLGFGMESHASKEIIIGKPDKRKENQVRKYRLKGNHWSKVKRMRAKSQTLGDPSLVQQESSTTMSFKKRLEEDHVMNIKKGVNEFFVVVGSENMYHKIKKTKVFSLDLSMETEAVQNKSNLKPAQSETIKTDAKAEASEVASDAMAKPEAPVQWGEEVEYPGTHHTHKQKGFKRQGIIFIIVGTSIGAVSLVSLLVGIIVMRRKKQPTELVEQFPLMEDMDEVQDLS